MNVSHVEPVAVFRRVGITVEPVDAAVSGLLVLVANDGPQYPGAGRVGAPLAQVVACFGQVPKVIDHACGDKGRPEGVEGDPVGIAGSFREKLELMGDGVKAPQRAGERVLFALVADDAGVEHTVEAIKPAIGAKGEGTGKLVRVVASKPGDHHLGVAHRFEIITQRVKEQIRRVGDPYPAMAHRNAGWDIESIGKDGRLVRLAVVVCVLQHLDTVATLASRHAGVFDTFGDPDSTAVIETHGDWVDQHWLAGDQVHLETFGNLHLADRLGWLQSGPRGRGLIVGDCRFLV